MPTITPEAFRKQLAKGAPAPVYILSGDDEAGKASLIGALMDTVEPELRAFNVDRLYALEADVRMSTILDAARTLAWMASRRLVIVAQADRLLVQRGSDQEGGRDVEALEAYLENPVPSTTLVLVVSALDRRLNVTKSLYRAAAVVECGGVADGREVESLIKSRASAAGVTFEPAAIRAFVQRTGGNVARVRAELDRLLLFASAAGRVTAADVDALISGPGVQDVWALNRALERNKPQDALRELALLLDEGAVPVMVLGQIRAFVDKGLPAARMAAATDALLRTDLALKSSGGDPRVLLERLVVELTGKGNQ